MRLVVAAVTVPLLLAACQPDGFVGTDDDAGDDGAVVDAAVERSSDVWGDTDSSGPDGSPDATDATACPISGQDPPPIATSCTTGSPNFAAGAIPSGTYALTILRDFASDCTTFVPVQASGLLQVTSQGGNNYLIHERVTVDGVVTQRKYTATVSGSNMTVTLTCGPAILNPIWQLYVTVPSGKTQLVVLKQTTANNQRYFWLEQ